MQIGVDTCVCILFYGREDFCYRLAERVFNEPMTVLANQGASFVFGLNAVGEKTKDLVYRNVGSAFSNSRVVESEVNIFKYPMMRKMFYADSGIPQQYLVWFDDNSYLLPDIDAIHWLSRLKKQLTTCDVLGSVYTASLTDEQVSWVSQQNWSADKPVTPYIKYVSGAWWCAKSAAVFTNGWPSRDLRHHGGDVIMGEFCRHRDLQLCHFRDGVAINVNSSGVEGATHRRGLEGGPFAAAS